MAHIKKEEVAQIRKELKDRFKNDFKFGVRKNAHSSTVEVTIKSGKVDFSDILDGRRGHAQVNPYHTHNYGPHKELFDEIFRIMKTAPGNIEGGRAHYDNSDSMTDYFDTAFYVDLDVGDYNQPYQCTGRPGQTGPWRDPKKKKTAQQAQAAETPPTAAAEPQASEAPETEVQTRVVSTQDDFIALIKQAGYTRHNHRDLWFSRVEDENGLMASVHFEETMGGKPSIRFGAIAENLPFPLYEETVKVLDSSFQEAVEEFSDLDRLISTFEYRPGETSDDGEHVDDKLHLVADPTLYIECERGEEYGDDRFISACMDSFQWDADGHPFVSIFNAMRAIEHVASPDHDPEEPEPAGFEALR